MLCLAVSSRQLTVEGVELAFQGGKNEICEMII